MPLVTTDPVDTFIAQWVHERPDLQFGAMATIARIGRLTALVGKSIEAVLGEHGLHVAEFDVLAALRRMGAPYTATPSALTRALMLSPAGMTSRLDRLEAAGHIERLADPGDRRSLLVVLTERGRATIDAAVVDHVANEERLLAELSDRERGALDTLLRKLSEQFEG